MTIGETLKKLRKKRKLSQKEVADKSNISRTYISEIESGRTNPTYDILERIGNVLNIPFPIISYLSLDINSLPENHQKAFRDVESAVMAMIDDYIQNETKKRSAPILVK
jgi:transcriptional regulator with XRE-family HTH domain